MENRNLGDDFLRFVAIALVINSHMDAFYPIHYLGTGGAIGNALFFMLSAYGLLLSEKKRPQTFGEYLSKRIRRIYPPVWTAILVLIFPLAGFYYFNAPDKLSVMAREFHLLEPLTFASIAFYPPRAFWFLQALMLYYLAGFLFIKNYSTEKIFAALALSVLVYLLLYSQIQDFSRLAIEQDIEFKLTFYFAVFLLGLFLASHGDRVQYTGKRDVFFLLAALVLLYGHKLIAMNGSLLEFQFIQQLAIFPLLFFSLKVARSDFVKAFMRTDSQLSKFVKLVAAMTLELYIVHGPMREVLLPYIGEFPWNVLLYLPLVFIFSYALYRLNRSLIDRITAASEVGSRA